MARPRTFDQDDTLDAISKQFWETGYAGTSVDDLMECTGLGKGSLYGAFGSKHDMYVRSVRDYAEETASNFEAALAGSDAGAMRRLRAVFRNMATSSCSRRLGCLLGKAVSERAGADAEVDAIARDAFSRMEAALREVLEAAQRAGDLDRKLDAKKTALTLFAVMRGMDAIAKSGASEPEMLAAAEGALALLKR